MREEQGEMKGGRGSKYEGEGRSLMEQGRELLGRKGGTEEGRGLEARSGGRSNSILPVLVVIKPFLAISL